MEVRLILLISLLSCTHAWLPMEDWGSGNVTSSGVGDLCACSLFLPDVNFPADRVQHMQRVSSELRTELHIHMDKLVLYGDRLSVYLEDLDDLEVRVSMMESSPDDYVQLDFELLKVELRELEVLVSELQDSVNSSSPALDALYEDIHNMTSIVNQLETYDESNLDVIRIEFAKLQKKLEICQKEHDFITPHIGNCNHTGIVGVGKPSVLQLNAHLKPGYQFGGWGKDSKPVRGHESLHWYGAYSSPSVYEFYFYSDFHKLLQRSSFTHHALPQGYEGSGNNYVVHGNAVYYQASDPLRMTKLNLTSALYTHRQVSRASSEYSYSYSPNQLLDFSADEEGLWVMYATDEAKGKISVAKVDERSFGIEGEWTTAAFKPLTGNAFMACGVMYATRPKDLKTEEIYYAYDTRTRQQRYMSVPIHKFQEKFVNLHYNPTDQKLYMYNDGYYVSYSVKFSTQ